MFRAQVWRSIGYSFRFIGQDRVNEILDRGSSIGYIIEGHWTQQGQRDAR